MPPLHPHILRLAKDLDCSIFIESGTASGVTYRRAVESGYFDRVFSVEIVPELAQKAAGFYSSPNYLVFEGQSHVVLKEQILPRCSEADRIFLFLDGHYSEGATGGSDAENPLILELQTIRKFCPSRLIILAIDDTDDFGRIDPLVHGHNWPSRQQVETEIKQFPQDFMLLDYSGAVPHLPKIYRGLLIYTYRLPSESWLKTRIHASWPEARSNTLLRKIILSLQSHIKLSRK